MSFDDDQAMEEDHDKRGAAGTRPALRGFVDEQFHPGTIRELRPEIEEFAHDFWTRSRDSDRIDIVGDFAYPFPVTVIAELLGIPAERRDQFKA